MDLLVCVHIFRKILIYLINLNVLTILITEIKMYECLIRNHEVKTIPIYTVADAVASIKAEQSKKRRRRDQDDDDSEALTAATSSEARQDPPNLYVSKTPNETKGHTSYMTFATFLPILDDEL